MFVIIIIVVVFMFGVVVVGGDRVFQTYLAYPAFHKSWNIRKKRIVVSFSDYANLKQSGS